MIAIITFYTPEYTQEANEWRRTCHQYLNCPFKSYEVESKGSWVHNCTMKADIVLKALDEFEVSYEECFYIGDQESDEISARNANINFSYVNDISTQLIASL